jgi:general secretion pathway protein D
MRIKTESRFLVSLLLTFCLLLLPVTAMAKKGDKNFKAGMKYEANQQWEKAAQEFTLALAADPSNSEYHLHFRRASFNASQAYMQQGRALAEQNDFVGAYNAFRQAYGYDPVNELAVSEMERMLRLQQVKEGNNNPSGTRISDARDANGNPTSAVVQEQVSSAPQQMRVIAFSGDLKAFIRKLADELDLNVIFDRQSFVSPKNIDINLHGVSTAQALDYIFLQEGLFFQKLSRKTIVVADQTRRPQYQQLVLRTFYLANTDPEKAKTLVGQAIPPSVGRPQTIAVADKDTNSLTVRDTAENVRLIGELIESIDKDRAEVVMDVNIYEVSKANFLQLGNQIGTPGSNGVFNLGGSPGISILSSTGSRNGNSPGVNLAGLIGGVPTALAAAFVLPPSVFTAFQSKNNTKLIASTQVHAFNNEESTARIGQRVPVQTAQAYPFGVQTGAGTGTGGLTGGFPTGGFPVINYEPTGLTLKFTPQVFPNQDVQVKMSIESKDVLGASTLTPTFTERTITGTARVQNNRTMMLASVSQDVQSNGRQGLPILGLIPVLGRLFTSPTNDNRRIDIVIAVTPRVLRAPAVTPRDLEMRPSGTLQSPTTGSLEAMLREADHEDQLAAAQLEKRNAIAKATAPADASIALLSAKNGETAPAANTQVANNPAGNPTVNSAAAPANTVATAPINATVAKDSGVVQSPAVSQQNVAAAQTSAAQSAEEELSAFVPAPKSLVSNQSASEVAAINTNLNTGANAVLTSLPKHIETAVSTITPPVRTAQISLNTGDEILKVGEKRWVTLKLNSDVSLALGTVALRFDPKVLKIRTVSAGTLMARVKSGSDPSASITQSIDPAGVCMVSISNLNGVASIKGEGVLLFIEVEALAPGDAAITFEKGAMHFVGTDARDVVVEVSPIRATVKQ